MDEQYRKDSARLSVLIEKYTNIPQERVYHFVMENTADMLLSHANTLCKTQSQRDKLSALFEFKNLYETVKSADKNRAYHLTCPDDAKAYFRNLFADELDKERFVAAFLNSKNRVIKTKTMSVGTVGQAPVFPREIIKEALFVNAASVMLAHNHPSGDTQVSRQDTEVTMNISNGLEFMGIKLLDHVIIAGDQAVSLVEIGNFPINNVPRENLKTAATTNEAVTKYSHNTKKPGIMRQLASAAEQLEREQINTEPRKKTHNRGDR